MQLFYSTIRAYILFDRKNWRVFSIESSQNTIVHRSSWIQLVFLPPTRCNLKKIQSEENMAIYSHDYTTWGGHLYLWHIVRWFLRKCVCYPRNPNEEHRCRCCTVINSKHSSVKSQLGLLTAPPPLQAATTVCVSLIFQPYSWWLVANSRWRWWWRFLTDWTDKMFPVNITDEF